VHDKCRGDLYHFPSLEHSSSKCVLSTVRLMLRCWHERLGHPSLFIVQRVLSENKLVVSKESSLDVVCDACQCGKSHQLLFPKFFSVPKAPLDLIFLDVWEPAPNYVGKNNYYVKNKSKVFC
jgi:hypothetical protein